jgi:glutaminyl-tRNA synthetase
MSKRKILQLVQGGFVNGWDDPRMLTISGMRRRGYPAAAIRAFCAEIGIGKKESWIDMSVLEEAVRQELGETAPRVMAVLKPLRVIIDNYPQEHSEELEAQNHPQKPEMGCRLLPFSREIYIEQDDFMEEPSKKFFRLGPGREVRLRYGYFIRCVSVDKNSTTGAITALHCLYDPESRGGSAPDGRKVKGTIHWVSARHAVSCPVNLYDRLFLHENPDADKEVDFKTHLNPDSLTTLQDCMLEPSLDNAQPGDAFQFERQGYFVADLLNSQPGAPVFNRTVSLKDSWAKVENSGKK